ncbi:hypothetical protein EDD16DRAFT_1533188, partial [Pisolithus croceorrhizus]
MFLDPVLIFKFCITVPGLWCLFFPLHSPIFPATLDGLRKTSKLQILVLVQVPSLREGEALCPRKSNGCLYT